MNHGHQVQHILMKDIIMQKQKMDGSMDNHMILIHLET